MDVFYPLRADPINAPLRYSLRALCQNFPVDNVWVAGYKPDWLVGVGYMPTHQRGTKHQNSTANLLTGCFNAAMADDFVLMNDDFFILEPVEEIETLHRGRVADVLLDYAYRGSYRHGMAQTAALMHELGVADPLSYELHVPMVLNRRRMVEALHIGLEAMPRLEMTALHKRSLYGNLFNVGGREVGDVKIKERHGPLPKGPYVSTSPGSWVGRPGKRIRNRFPEPSKFERS